LSWQKAIILNPNEQVLHSWEGDCKRHYKTVEELGILKHRTVHSKESNDGTLVLTNQRLIWFEKRGILSKTQRVSFDIDLNNLLGITSGGTVSKWVLITDRESDNTFHLRGVGKKEIESFRDMIIRQVEKVKATAIGTTPAVPTVRQEVVLRTLDLNELIRQVREEGIVVVYRCPNCGGKLKISKDTNVEALKVCEHCGSEIETVDLADSLRTALS
jgi:DNA-directed RNA polymerase subunit RPC12/RpoP